MSDESFSPEPASRPWDDNEPRGRPPLPHPDGDPQSARQRLLWPGLLVILVGVLNLLPGVCCSGFGYATTVVPEDQVEQQLKVSDPKGYEDFKKQGNSVAGLMKVYLYGGIAVGVASLLLGLAAVVGGFCMVFAKFYALAMLGALAAIISPGGFLILGLAAGAWAAVVLLREDVKPAFR